MMFRLANQYNENEDATSISHKRFTEIPENIYPALSICFEGSSFHWYNDLEIFSAFGTNSYQFEQIVKGQAAYRYSYNTTSMMYKKTPVAITNRSYWNFDTFRLHMSDILVQAKYRTENPADEFSYENSIASKAVEQVGFHISYETPEQICFTRYSNNIADAIRKEDWLGFNMSIMSNGSYRDTEMKIFLHYPGQLALAQKSPGFESVFSKYQWKSILEFKLYQGTLVKRRADAKKKCNDQIGNHDIYLQKEISKAANCVPPYWNETFASELGIGICDTSRKLKIVHSLIDYPKKMTASLDPPCFTWLPSLSYNWKSGIDGKVSYIRIVYQDQYYVELAYSKAFGLIDFLSGVGGFAGLFIGFSLMQCPEMIGKYILDRRKLSFYNSHKVMQRICTGSFLYFRCCNHMDFKIVRKGF